MGTRSPRLWRTTFPRKSRRRHERWHVRNCNDAWKNSTWHSPKLEDTVNYWTRRKHTCILFIACSNVGFWPRQRSFTQQLSDIVSFLFLDLAAKEEERVWIKRQADGELDYSRLTEGLTGEMTIYKRRGMEKPELGRPQLKCIQRFYVNFDSLVDSHHYRPKRIRFIFDLSGSMYILRRFFA